MIKKLVVLTMLYLLAGCSTYDTAGEDSISGEDLSRHIQVLASVDFEGRGPSSAGEE